MINVGEHAPHKTNDGTSFKKVKDLCQNVEYIKVINVCKGLAR